MTILLDRGPLRLRECRHGPMLYLTTDQYVGRSLDLYGEFSEGELELLLPLLPVGGVALDVGANMGTHTVGFAHRVGSGGAVVAIEPQRFLHQILAANAALTGLPVVHAVHAAAGRHAGTISVPVLDPAVETNFGGLEIGNDAPGEPVTLLRIDDLGLSRCDLMKIDAEAMESDVLAGAAGTIRRCRPALYVENDRPARSAVLIGALLEFDYDLYWHVVPLFRADNWRGETENVFGGTVSVNLLCLPDDSPHRVEGLRPVAGPSESPEDILRDTPATPE